MTENVILALLGFVVTLAYTLIVFRMGVDAGRRRLYAFALEMQRKSATGEDLSLEAQLERNSNVRAGKVFSWGVEALPGMKYYGVDAFGFQIGYWDKSW
jgi:hypothetical protein